MLIDLFNVDKVLLKCVDPGVVFSPVFRIRDSRLVTTISQSHKFHNAPVPYPKIHHLEYISVHNGVLWDIGQVNREICETSLLRNKHSTLSVPRRGKIVDHEFGSIFLL